MKSIDYKDLKNGCNYIVSNAEEKKPVEIDGEYYGTAYIMNNDVCITSKGYSIFAKKYRNNEFVIYVAFDKTVLKILNPGLIMECDKDSCKIENKFIRIKISFYGITPKDIEEIPAGFCHDIDNETYCYDVEGVTIEVP